MTTKSRIIFLLESNKGQALSGQEIADSLGMTRASVWKAIQSLRKDGYDIEATTNKGYALNNCSNIISKEGVQSYLNHNCPNIEVYDQIPSTNALAMIRAEEGAQDYHLIIAQEQTKGRGRVGRVFESPVGGVYFSFVLNKHTAFDEFGLVTPAIAVAVAKAIESLCNIEPKIKWVNDIYYKGKKLCGVLTQATTDMESGKIRSLIIGVGINVDSDFSQYGNELEQKAGSLAQNNCYVNKNQLIAQVINNFVEIEKSISTKEFMQDYRAMSLVVGKQVQFEYNNQVKKGVVQLINDNGGLVVDCGEEIINLSCGEISIQIDKKWL